MDDSVPEDGDSDNPEVLEAEGFLYFNKEYAQSPS